MKLYRVFGSCWDRDVLLTRRLRDLTVWSCMPNPGKLLAVLVFLSLVADVEGTLAYYNDLWTPGRLVEWLVQVLPIRLTIFQLVCIGLMLFGRKLRKANVPKPLLQWLYVSGGALLFCIVYGLARGGEVKPLYTQGIAWIHFLIFTAAAIKSLSKPEDFARVMSAIAYAAIWRACVACVYYFQVKDRPWQTLPSYMTTHEDTVLFVVGLLILVSRLIEHRTKQARRMLYWAGPLILAAIQFNNRRLAWVSLAFGAMVLYFILPARSKLTRRVNRAILVALPLLLAYVTIGWGRPEKIFRPLASFASVGGGAVDASTKARDNENLALVIMVGQKPVLGTGLGHQWVEVDRTHAVPLSIFPMYYYCPHNSVLALFAFCGWVGFSGLWLIIPVSVFLNARTYRASPNPSERVAAVTGIVQVTAYLNQAYGDMGAMGPPHLMPATMLGIAVAAAAKLSIRSGGWPSQVPSVKRTSPNEPVKAS